ncbi:MAG: 3-dehydroquinate synthase [Planctomycetota bacterium]|jgi:3-dehydroquinate synthase|nr:3-dehydroquinate synthase [Planctomycetota bacterium]
MSSPLTLSLKLPGRNHEYEILIGSGLLQELFIRTQFLEPSSVLFISDSNVAPIYLDDLLSQPWKVECSSLVLPAGEHSKSWSNLQLILDQLLEMKMDRRGLVIGLGGGVIGDIAALGASIYLRGIPVVHAPTTLLAQVDSAIGGKTAINHPLGKNLIGTFHQPSLVLSDTNALRTLPPRQLAAGMAELLKAALIADADLTASLEQCLGDCLVGDCELAPLIAKACEIKAKIVREDEHESGVRKFLNFGHTLAHALEASTPTGKLLHGEAVIHGMRGATVLSHRIGLLDLSVRNRILCLLDAFPSQSVSQWVHEERFWNAIHRDKKFAHGYLDLVLLRAIGSPVIEKISHPRQWITIPD